MRDYGKLLGLIALAFFIGGCASDGKVDEENIYKGTLSVNISKEQIQSVSASDSVSYVIKDSNGQAAATFGSSAEIPAAGVTLKVGDYDLVATSTAKKMPLFERPTYSGSSKFTITSNGSTSLSLQLKQSNFAVGIAYSSKFKAENTSYSVKIASPDGTLSYSGTETRLGYFSSGPLTITITYTDKNGAVQSKQHTIDASSQSIAPASKLILNVKMSDETTTPGSYTGYYQNASGKTGVTLKEALTTIITTGFTSRTYDELWGAYKDGDIRKDGTGAIWDVYSDIPSGSSPYLYQPGQNQCGNYQKEGDCYNREHTIPKSWFNDQSPMYSDYLHILPTDGYVNSKRSNYPYGEVGTATWTSKNGSKLGSAKSTLGYSGTVFEPIDAYKGDIARIYFYFVTRYADKLAGYDSSTTEEVFNASNKGLDQWVVDMLIRWSKNDPVSQKEIDRNNEAEAFQKNRNPFVDHPEFVEMIWSASATKSTLSTKNGISYLTITVK